MDIEENMFPRNIKGIAKGLDISGFGIVEYFVRSESGRIIVLQDQAYYVPGLPKDLPIFSPQGNCTAERYTVTFIAHCRDEHGSYAEHKFRLVQGTEAYDVDTNLLQKIMDMREAVLFEVFLYIHNSYDALDWDRCLDIFAAYRVDPRMI